ncbi:hypothetical protein JCM8097_002051 [Rhodosporidiobolus ruineniae]
MGVVSLSPLHSSERFGTVDAAYRLFRWLFLSPSVAAGGIAGALFTAHNKLSTAPLSLSSLWTTLTSPALWCTLRSHPELFVIPVVSIGLQLNYHLNRAARNNYTRSRKSWKWDDEVVIVTGGSGGLGSDVVRRLAERGTKVAILDIAPPISDTPRNVHFFKVDISSKEAVEAAAKQISEELGHPSVLINMAGVVRAKSVLEMEPRDVDLTFDINVKAHYYTVQAFLPRMIEEGKGHVITIASAMSYVQAASGVSYCSSKAAALSFHEGLTTELRHLYQPAAHARAIRTSVVCPAHFKTQMFEGFRNAIPGWAAPSLEVGTVAKLVCETVWSGESQHIIEPFYAKMTPFGRALPTWIYNEVLRLAKDAMGFVGQAQRAKEAKKPETSKEE